MSSRMTTISSLTDALLRAIFVKVKTTPVDAECSFCSGTAQYGKPFACVSRHWRKVVEDTPELWTEFDFVLRKTNSPKLARLYFERSGDKGLDIRINALWRGEDCPTRAEPMPRFRSDFMTRWNIVLSCMDICRRLEIHANFPVPVLLMSLAQTRTPKLEEIVVHYPHDVHESRHGFYAEDIPITKFCLKERIASAMFYKHMAEAAGSLVPAMCPKEVTLSGTWVTPQGFTNMRALFMMITQLILIGEPVDFIRENRSGTHMGIEIEPSKTPMLRTLIIRPEADTSDDYLLGVLWVMDHAPVLEELVLDFRALSRCRLQSLAEEMIRDMDEELPEYPLVLRLKVYIASKEDETLFSNGLECALPGLKPLFIYA